MSFATIRPLFRSNFDSLGYREWQDGFNFENIPANLLHESYHIEVGVIAGGTSSTLRFDFAIPILVRVFLKGYRDPAEAIDDALLRLDQIYEQVLSPSERYGSIIKDVTPETASIIPLGPDNDNALVIELGFNTRLITCYDQ